MVEAASLILAAAGRTLGTTVLNKALFLLDLRALLEDGEQVTDATYVALKAGPVVESYNERLIRALEHADIAMQDDEDDNYKPVTLLHPVTPTLLTERQQQLADAVGRWAKDQTAQKVKDLFHKNVAWLAAWKDGDGQGNPINMHLAIQQLGDDDPWLKEPWAREEQVVLEQADSDEYVEW
jgi:Antitoxin SocA-like, Panacea domain